MLYGKCACIAFYQISLLTGGEAETVAYGAHSQAPHVAVTSAVLFFAGAVYIAFGEKLLGKK